jgi:hypothetical protein
MSVFKVKLTNVGQGLLDSVGQSQGNSIQRTVYVMGPGKINRKLKDGDTFTDVNYWKRFAYPQVPYDQALIEVVTDDGAPYYDGQPELSTIAKNYALTLTAGQTYSFAGHVVDILTDTGGYATFCQITPTVACKVRFNGNVNAIMNLAANSTQIFNPGDLTIGKLEFDNSASGASSGSVAILVSVQAVANS